MAVLTEAEFKNCLKAGSFSKVYFVYGNEPYLKSFYISKLMEKAVKPDFSTFNLHIFDSSDVDLKEVSQCVEALPMMDERVCVVVKDLNLSNLNKQQSDMLEQIVTDVPDTSMILFWMQNVEVETKRNEKWKKVLQLFEKNADVLELNKRTSSQLVKILVSGAKKRGKNLSDRLAGYLITLVGDDLNVLLNETEKLCFFCKEETVTKEDIDAIVTKSVEASVFDLARHIVSSDSDRAFRTLSALIASKTDPININAALISAYVDMYRAKVFVTSGFQATEAAKYYNYRNKEFRLRNALRDASKVDLRHLRACLDVLADTDIKLKSTSADKRILLEETVVKLMLESNNNAL
ncbi:MAG: DNA polymerase III subunit delta [Clostridia bacterium]|nr:DNA polymerase III subunit delta [Clostridia bacterium]